MWKIIKTKNYMKKLSKNNNSPQPFLKMLKLIRCIYENSYVWQENPLGKWAKMYYRHPPEGIPFHGIPIRLSVQQTNNHFSHFCMWSVIIIGKYIYLLNESEIFTLKASVIWRTMWFSWTSSSSSNKSRHLGQK